MSSTPDSAHVRLNLCGLGRPRLVVTIVECCFS